MLRQIREHDLQFFLVDYLIGPAFGCDFIGSRGNVDIFKIETTTGLYELHVSASPATISANDNCEPIARLDGSRTAKLNGHSAWILPGGDRMRESYYFYKQG